MKDEGLQKRHVLRAQVAKTAECQYLLFLPKGYDATRNRWPLILFLHGLGESGDDIEKVMVHGIPKILKTKPEFPFIVVSPQCPEGEWWDPDILIALLNEVISKYRVDEDRVCATGLSMGGAGTWDVACRYPEKFSAIIPVSGFGNPFLACKLKNVAVWIFHNESDTSIPAARSKEMAEAIKKSGGRVRETYYPRDCHDAWTETYNDKDIYDWLLAQKND